MAGKVRRVLVIDDAAGVRAVVCDFLTGFGYDADEAEDGAGGLALFDRVPLRPCHHGPPWRPCGAVDL